VLEISVKEMKKYLSISNKVWRLN